VKLWRARRRRVVIARIKPGGASYAGPLAGLGVELGLGGGNLFEPATDTTIRVGSLLSVCALGVLVAAWLMVGQKGSNGPEIYPTRSSRPHRPHPSATLYEKGYLFLWEFHSDGMGGTDGVNLSDFEGIMRRIQVFPALEIVRLRDFSIDREAAYRQGWRGFEQVLEEFAQCH
jgi:hypothetical protein